ncbi:MAG TPA: hypothetical protein VFF73_12965 [Planctomycetota bacterium]|nr:hypothetical protein [Planctomycetota bacterium]
MLDPEVILHGVGTNPDAHTLEPVATPGCTVLLGEPGMGKSTCIAALAETIAAQAGVRTQRFSLGEFQSDERLERRIFGSPEARAWREGTETLHLLLDGLDEGCVWMPSLPRVLEGMLRDQPTDRLRLYLACRSTIWPATLESFLRERFPESVEVLELLPLRERDVLDQANDGGVDPQSFLRAVRDRRVEAFAAKPITLRFLLSVFRRNGALPERESDLYGAGCLHLCEEPDPARRTHRRPGALSARQRLELAERIAAGMTFCSRAFVWTGENDPPPGAVTLEELTTARDPASRPSRENLLEVLDTGLFSVKGPNRVGWSHQTYEEYLAAGYCLHRNVAPDRLLDMLSHNERDPRRVAPQLRETAAWLASMRQDMFTRLLRVDPQVLLESDTSNTSHEDRSQLVSSLLSELERGELDEDVLMRWADDRRLAHPGLANQLEPYIVNRARPSGLRETAIGVARACSVSTLMAEITDIALDPDEPLSVRIASARAVRMVGSLEQRRALTPLIHSIEEDSDDQLKGNALLALWPDGIAAREMFPAVTLPRNSGFAGTYSHFLWSLSEEMARLVSSPEDLVAALNWVASQPARMLNTATFGLGRVIVSIFELAWSHLGEPRVLDAFVAAAHTQLLRHEVYGAGRELPRLAALVASDDTTRRRVIHRALELSNWTFDRLGVLEEPLPWIRPERDVGWLAENTRRNASDLPQVRKWTDVLEHFSWRVGSLTPEYEEFYRLYMTVPHCRGRFTTIFGPIPLHSEQAGEMREQLARNQEARRRLEEASRPEEREPDLPQPARILRWLERFEGGQSDAFWLLQHDLSAEPDSDRAGDLTVPDFTRYPGWQSADDATRLRIIAAGRQYLVNAPGMADEWLGTNQQFWSELAAFRTMYVLLRLDPAFLDSLPPEVWERWAPICLGYHAFSTSLEDESYWTLAAMAYHRAPATLLRALDILMRQEAMQHDHVFVVRRLMRAWDEPLARHVLSFLDDSAVRAGSVGSVLDLVLPNVPVPAIAWCNCLLDAGVGTTETTRSRFLAVASAMLRHASGSVWPRMFALMQSDPGSARAIFLDHADRADHSPHDVFAGLNEAQLADAYVWLESQFPVNEDPQYGSGDFHRVMPRDQVGDVRNHALQSLIRRGTREAIIALESVCVRLPQHEWLRRALLQARETMLERTWIPPTPLEFFGLLEDPQTHRVESESQLLEIVAESLSRLQLELRGEIPASVDLWDRVPGGQLWRPKPENDLSNYVARHLRRDLCDRGIIVGREVEIRPSIPPTTGEVTDIHVDAVAPAPRPGQLGVVTIIIEAKGSWNDGLFTDMQGQLRDRYLAENACQYGLYLVGWYLCEQWDPADWRSTRATARRDLRDLRSALEGQARQLSTEGAKLRAVVLDVSLPG